MARSSSRIYWRRRGKVRRAYADFADVGGGQEALIPAGARAATADPAVAEALVAERLKDLQERRRNKTLLGVERQATLAEYAAHHLKEKKRAGKVSGSWIGRHEKKLRDACDFFGAGRELSSISVRDVQRWSGELGKRPGRGKNNTLSGGTIHHYLSALSNLYRRAASEEYVPPGYNPVAAMMEKPTPSREEARWLEVHEAAMLLEAARHSLKRFSESTCVAAMWRVSAGSCSGPPAPKPKA